MAVHPNSTTEILERVVAAPDAATRRAVLDHPNRPAALAPKPAEPEIGDTGLADPGCDPETLERHAAHPDHYTRMVVASNPSTPVEALGRLAQDSSSLVAAGVGWNPDCPAGLLETLAAHKAPSVRWAVACHASTPAKRRAALRKDLVEHGDNTLRELIARDPDTPADALTELVQDSDPHVREAASRNPAVPVAALAGLARSDDAHDRTAVAEHAACPPALLGRLAADSDWKVRSGVAKSPATPPEVLRRLANDDNVAVRWYVAANPATHPDLLTGLADDTDPHIHLALARNPATPTGVLARLDSHDEPAVRYAAATHPARPEAPVDVDEIFSLNQPSHSGHAFALGASAHLMAIAGDRACGKKVRRTGLSCLLAPKHKGHCRSILA